MRRILAILVILHLPCCLLWADDWPTDLHDAVRSGVTSEHLSLPLHLQWTFTSPSPPAPGWSLPVNGYGARKNKPNACYDDAFRVIVVGDMCYFCSSAENRVLAVDARDGKVVWSIFADAAPRLAPAYWEGKLYFGADDGIFRCLDATTGILLWQINASPDREMILGYGRFHAKRPIRATCAVVDGVVYFAAGLFPQHGVQLYAVRAHDGAVLWRTSLTQGGAGDVVPQGPILVDDHSLWLTSRIVPARFRRADGQRIGFSTPFPDVANSHEYRYYNGGTEAQLHGDQIVYGSACKLAYTPDATWKDKWGKTRQGQLDYAWFNARQIRFHDGVVYVATDDYLCAVEEKEVGVVAEGPCRRYEEAYKRFQVASYLDVQERHHQLVDEFGAEHARVQALERGPLKWGRDNWTRWQELAPDLIANIKAQSRWLIEDQETEAMIVAGNILFAGGEDHLLALDLATGTRLWSFRTDCRVRGLAVANGRLLVSTTDGVVRCFADRPTRSTSVPLDEGGTPGRAGEVAVRDANATAVLPFVGQSSAVMQKSGYCLLVGCENLVLPLQLARMSKWRIVVLEQDAARVDRWRRELVRQALYGARVAVYHASKDVVPFPPYVFDVVIDQQPVHEDRVERRVEAMYRVTKPCGGKMVLTIRGTGEVTTQVVANCVGGSDIVSRSEHSLQVARGRLPETQDWTHNYATAANTYCSEDRQVRGPFDVLWYGEPGPRDRIDRHATPPMPLVVGATMFTLGPDQVMAYDIYNGVCLWRRALKGATRSNLPLDTSNLAADQHSLFVVVGDEQCLQLDAENGETIRMYEIPEKRNDGTDRWAWIARVDDGLFGSLAEASADGRRTSQQTSNAVFALDASTGVHRWVYHGNGIDHDGIAVAQHRVFLIDRTLDRQERQQALESVPPDSFVPDRPAQDRRGNPIAPDLRKIVVLDATTGIVLWQRPWNLSDVTLDDNVVQGRSAVACMVAKGVLVLHGAGSLGHPHREFLAGEFDRRALYAFDAATGDFLWGGRRGYRKRPIIVGDRIYAEPFAWDLRSGKQVMVSNPLSGAPQPLDFHRGYIGCGHLMASGTSLFGAKNGIAFCNMDDLSGFTPFSGLALACGLDAVPAGGVFVIPEGRSGCTCDTPIHTSISLYPRPVTDAWGIGFAGGRSAVHSLPVKHVAINLGAPGFRQDVEGNLWIPYPRPIDTGLLGDWLPRYQHSEEMCYQVSELSPSWDGDSSWIYTSGYSDEKPLVFAMRGEDAEPARYTVTLHFAEPEETAPGKRLFSVVVQDRKVAEEVDLSKLAGGCGKPYVITCRNVLVKRNLTIRLIRSEKSTKPPVLCGFQVRENPPVDSQGDTAPPKS